MPHPKWDERPLLIAVAQADATEDKESVLKYIEERVAKWQIPDDVLFVAELPHGATGKLNKLKLREDFSDYKFPGT